MANYRRRRYRQYRGRGRGGATSYDAGIEAARQHIREAREFASEVGGTDADVKDYFFNLSQREFKDILSEYGRTYGAAAKEYAELAYQRWRSGSVKMSGMVAKRLFSLLPRRMPIRDRLDLVESLWRHFRPRKKAYFVYGVSVVPTEFGDEIKAYFDENARGHEIPSEFKARFLWLSDGDSTTYEQLLNHYLELDRRRVGYAVGQAVEVVQRSFANQADTTQIKKFSQTVEVDGCTVEILFNPDVPSFSFSDSPPPPKPAPRNRATVGETGSGWGCLPIIGIIVAAKIGLVFMKLLTA